jgi:RimJ/RimL family protein N-acetyltransferase
MKKKESAKPDLKSATLRFEIIDGSHLKDVFNTMNCRETAEMLTFLTWPMTQEQAQSWVETSIKGLQDGKFLFVAYDKKSGAAVGCICALPWEGDLYKTEIGYWVTQGWKGKGIATEMIRAALDFAFRSLKTRTVVATVATHNFASQACLRKFGFLATGEKDKLTAKGTVLKLIIFELASEVYKK